MANYNFVIGIREKIPIKLSGPEYIVTDNSDYTITLEPDSEWDGLEAKTIYYVFDSGAAVVHPIIGNNDKIPIIQASGCVHIGVSAGELHTTRPLSIHLRGSIRRHAGTQIPEPAPDVYDKIMQLLNDLMDGGTGTDITLGITNATVGQIVKITEVDENGAPVKWESMEFEGSSGADGITPHIGDNGNWWIGDTDTGVSAQGPQGEPGVFVGDEADMPAGTRVRVDPVGQPIKIPVIDDTLSKGGYAADAAAVGDKIRSLSTFVTPQMFGAKGDGITDDSTAIQGCFDFASENNLPVQFGDGTYICYGVTLPAGVYVNGNGAILKKPNLSADPYNMTPDEMKWARLVSVSHSGDTDSKMTVIENLEFDGNCWEMWSVEDGYSQEQASLLFVSCPKDNAGKLFITIENCYFHDNVSDGIHIVTNTNAVINNCRSVDCFRGGLTVTGGNTTVHVDGFDFRSEQTPDGIDLEQDSNGYNDSKTVSLSLRNIQIDTDLDISVNSVSVVTIDNLSMRKGGYYLGGGGSLTVRNSTLMRDVENYTISGDLSNQIYAMTTSRYLFFNVVFDGNKCNVAGNDSACQLAFYTPSGMNITFDTCVFENAQWGIGGTGTSGDAKIHILNCCFKTENGYGGRTGITEMGLPFVLMAGNVFEVAGIAVQNINATVSVPQILKLRNNHIKSCETSLKLYRTTLFMDETWTNGLAVAYANGYSADAFYGKRVNIVSADPNGTQGIQGVNFNDVATDGTSYWRYSGSGTVWDPVETLLTEGADGKSAYMFAVEGGYTGTEAEFASDINPDNISANVADVVKAEIPLIKTAEQPTFANSVEDCTDTSKVYVLPDGYMWAFMSKEDYVLSADDFTVTNVGTSGELTSGNTRIATPNLLPLNSVISVSCPSPYQYFVYFFTADTTDSYVGKTAWKSGDIADVSTDTVASGTSSGAAYCRISLRSSENTVADLTDRVDEFLQNINVVQTNAGVDEWRSTGLKYNQPADYEDRIVALEKLVAELQAKTD